MVRIPKAAGWWSLVLATGIGCGNGDVISTKWNVVLVLVDTLRADHLSLYGYDRPTCPALEAFSREAIVFEEARSQAGCTFPSVNSLLTSQFPQVFVQEMKESGVGISERWPTLAQMLKAEGFATAAVSSSPIVRVNPSKHNPDGGFGAGFDVFDDSCLQKSAEGVNAIAFKILDRIEHPFFLYLHYMEPHWPYNPPNSHGPVFRIPSGQPVTEADRNPSLVNKKLHSLSDMLYDDGDTIEFTKADLARAINLYDEEIHYFDAQFRSLLDRLQAKGIADRTIIIVISDHGEELLDHGHIWHCRDLTFDTAIKTPLIMKIPGVKPTGRREVMAQNLDIIPTVLDYLAIDPSGYDLQGSSLRPVIEEGRAIHEYVFSSQRYSRSVTTGKYKLTYDINTGETRLYDLVSDPTEQRDIKANRPDVAEDLGPVLLDWMEKVEGHNGLADRVLYAKRVHDMLDALGYLRYSDEGNTQSGADPGESTDGRGLSMMTAQLVDGLQCGSLDGAILDKQGRVFIWGWAYDPRAGEPAKAVAILVNGVLLDLEVPVVKERTDVADFYNDPRRTYTGWNVHLPARELSAGEHHVRAYAIFADGEMGRLTTEVSRIVKVPED
jgi:arylsulfatase A-like enzyme